MSQSGSLYCTSCKKIISDSPKRKGSGWIEVVLWLCYIFPGLIYSIWRRSGDPSVCPCCKKETLIPRSYTKPADSWSEPEKRNQIECSWCAELILSKAKICKHCGKDVEPVEGVYNQILKLNSTEIDELINEREDTQLIEATRMGDIKSVEQLINSGANKEIKNAWGNTALMVAKREGHEEIEKILS